MNCPVCQEALQRLPYEGVPIYHCTGCHGHLLYPDQVNAVRWRPERDAPALNSEAQSEGIAHGELRCPRCRGPMKEQPSRRHSQVLWDFCHECDLVWLDAGELAKIQLERESSRQGEEYQRMRDYWKQKTPSEMTDFQQKLAERTRATEEPSPSRFAALLDFIFLRTPKTG